MKNLKRFLSILLITITSSFFIACNEKNVQTEEARGFLWRATKGENVIYLGGTMHPAPPNINYLNNDVKDILEKTDKLVVEVDLNESLSYEKSKKFFFTEKGAIEKELNEEEKNKLEEVCKDMGVNKENINTLSPYGFINLFNQNLYTSMGYNGEIVDTILIKTYKENKKGVDELENIDYQLNLLNELYNIKAMKELINNYSKENIENIKEQTEKLLEAYKLGQKDFPEEYIKKMKEEDKVSYEKLILKRNKEMSKKIEEKANKGEKIFVAVGYLHFIGEDSILSLLGEAGYKIEEI